MSNASDLQAALDLYQQQTGVSMDAASVLAGALALYSESIGGDQLLAAKDPATVIASALATYKEETGITLAPADPRRLHLQTLLLILSQQRSLIDFSGKQSLLRFVSDQWIDELAALWGVQRLPAKPSKTTERFSFATVAARTVPDGTRVSDGTSTWSVVGDTSATADHIDCTVQCTVTGASTNGIAEGQISTLVDPDKVPGCTGVSNIAETNGGREIEALEDFRARLRGIPETTSTAGPRGAYQELALAASSSVADAAAIGPSDLGNTFYTTPDPGQIFVLIIQGQRDDKGNLISVVPDPDDGLINTVDDALSAEDVRPLGDQVIVDPPYFVDFDAIATYYIGRSRKDQASSIQAAVQAAFTGWLLWQQSKIGRDINPSELTTRLLNAGAKRVAIVEPSFTALMRDEAARLYTHSLTYGGVEDD